MAEHCRFFNSSEGDVREYQAAEFAEYFSRFLSDGVYSRNGTIDLKVSTIAGLNVSVASGYAFIKGYLYHNDATLNLAIDAADTTLHRIDRVVIKFDEVAKNINIYVKKGNFGGNPVPPTLINTATVKELSLAQVRVNANASNVVVTDERLTSACGLVSLIIDIPSEDLWQDYLDWKQSTENNYQDLKTDLNADYLAWKAQSLNDFDAWKTGAQTQFNTWISDLQTILNTETAGNLLSLIQLVEADIESLEEDISDINTEISGINTQVSGINTELGTKMNNSRIIVSPNNANVNEMENGDVWLKYL